MFCNRVQKYVNFKYYSTYVEVGEVLLHVVTCNKNCKFALENTVKKHLWLW